MNTEIGSILRLNGVAGRIVLAVFGLGTIIVAILNLDGLHIPAFGIVSIVLFAFGLAFLAIGQGEPLGIGWTVGVLVVVVTTTAISTGNLVDPVNPGYATWPMGAMTFLLFVLALRNRKMLAWVGFVGLAVVSVVFASLAGYDLSRVINDVLRQSATLVIGTLFAIGLRRATHTIAAIQARELSRVSAEAAAATATQEREAQNQRLMQDARPALERIMTGQPFTTQELQAFQSLSATLRGGTQPAGSSGVGIAEAVRQARMRGLSVTLIDDRGTQLPAEVIAQLEEALLPLLNSMNQGSITVRLNPEGGADIATMVIEENGIYRRLVLADTTVGSYS